MAKKDKPAKEKSKTKQDTVGGAKSQGVVSKKKSEKVAANATGSGEKQSQQPTDPQVGASGNDSTGPHTKTGSFSSNKDGHPGGEVGAVRSSKVVGPPEWESEAIRNAALVMDKFSCCIVLVMEDSPELTRFGEFLLRAIETGVRRKFHCISGAQTGERVKRFLASHGHADDDQSYTERQDLYAEAIKHTLLGIKEHVATEIDADHQTKEMELAGARSKDLIRYVPPLTLSMQGSGVGIGSPGGDGDGIREPPPAPPPTEQSHQAPSLPSKKPAKTKSVVDESESKIYPVVGPTPSTKMGVKTRMRKRGEVPMPEFEVIDDSPPKGPRSYVLLQGFYNPSLIEELRKIGVKVDGILLMTDAKVNRYNFSIIDVEDSIPGTFRPRNVLPQYLKAIERLAHNPETRNSEVAHFWTKLSEMYNTASTDSPFHDIALMNFPLPDSKRINLESSDGITYYVSKVYDEVAKRVYEMLVLEEWFQEFTSAVDVTKLQPLEPDLPHDIYDQIVGQIPAECISVPIILEAVVQQVAHSLEKELGNPVPETCHEENTTTGIITGKSSFGTTNWGSVAHKNDERKHSGDDQQKRDSGSSLFKIPMYIKAGDYASIRSCHLNESLASKIASCQLSGDMRNIRGFLWQKVPEFNRGLYMKLLGNLNHFMYFMPPDMIQFEDMFYILHLLMSAGVEVHLQKAAENRQARTSIEPLKPSSILYKDGVYRHNRTEDKFPGTNLNTAHNYLAVSQKTGLHFVISPDSNHELTVASFGHSQSKPAKKNEQPPNSVLETFLKEAQQQQAPPSESEEPSETLIAKKAKRKKSRSHKHKELDVNKAARVTTVGAIQTAAKFAQNQNETTDKTESEILEKRKGKGKSKGKKGKAKEDESTVEVPEKQSGSKDTAAPEATESQQLPIAGGEAGQGQNAVAFEESRDTIVADRSSKNLVGSFGGDETERKTGFESMNYPSKETKRFIACEEQWFEDINDTSVIQALLECPALLAINESGALDLTKWIEKYLLSAGMDVGPGEGVLLGDLKNWNYVEELVPIQTVQMLNEASQEYLSMQRMYCPFYDTLLFIFNNPMPKDLTAETQFYFRLKTLPGLQHFLEYTMDDKSVLRWIEQLDSGKRLEAGEQTSINTLLSIIPEEQWLMVPSIKYQIMVENQRSLSAAMSTGSIATNKPAFYGKIGSYSKPRESTLPPSPELSGSTKSFVPSATGGGLNTSPSGMQLGENENGASDQITSAQDTVPSAESGENVDNQKSGTGSSKALSVKSGKATKSETATNKLDKKGTATSRLSKDESSPDQGATTAQNSPDSGIGDYSSLLDDKDHIHIPKKAELIKSSLNFTCYDLGKRVAVVGNDTFFLFPMDGTVIRYDISTIEPEFRMMQLTVTKSGHQTFFYPYYIPHDFDLSMEDYVVCPYFHMVLSNGTIFAFQDLRAEEAAPYLKIAMNKKNQQDQLFSFEKILFGKEVEKKLIEVASAAEKAEGGERLSSAGSAKGSDGKRKGSKESVQSGKKDAGSTGSGEKVDAAGQQADDAQSQGKLKGKKGLKEKKSKKLHDKSPDEKKDKKEKKSGKKDKKNKGNKAEAETEQEEESETGGASPGMPPMSPVGTEEDPEEMGDVLKGDGETDADEMGPAPPPTSEADEGQPGTGGEWMYPSSENSDEEAETQKRRLFFAPPWDDAVQLIQPMAHSFTVTLPSGLMATVEDLPGPPLVRIVKQNYAGHGSAKSSIEGSRYYTMDGSVIKFLLNGTIQILTARGVTTTIDELAANAKRETENMSSSFGSASVVKIFNGEVILPNGQLWQVVNGKKVSQAPIYVFTTGPLTGGEVFRRRQDGVVYLHRYDGTVITHYPDGTRFTTRMVILEKNTPPPAAPPATDTEGTEAPPTTTRNSGEPPPMEPVEEEPDEEFSDWVFVGLKYMIEHPNYSTVLFNTLSGNVHLKLPHGEWVRVFADGNVRISTEDQYCMDVDKDRALLSNPSCSKGKGSLPNLTAVRLWHAAPPGQTLPDGQADMSTIQTTLQKDSNAPKAAGEPTVEESQVHIELPQGFEEKETDNLAIGKKKSKNIHHAKSLHPKVKQREGTKTKGRATRQGSLVLRRGSEGKKDASAAAGKDALKTESRKNSEEEAKIPSSELFPPFSPPPSYAKPLKPTLRKSGDKLTEFLRFEDETTFCKAIDSWDNRFLMDVYGGAVVDKMERDSASKEMSTQHLIETLSEHSHLPKNFISGILRNTSSENLETAARRLQALRRGYNESCSGDLPNTKIFVVKRDLTAFQFLQKALVEDIVTKAYSSRESMVIVDPVPKRHPRKFVTIMRPVEEAEEPHGMWTRPYIEPMFRPRGVTNKHLRVATPNDLRWFGYVLNAAHGKRPKFVPEPKEVYREKKSLQLRAEMRGSSESPQDEPARRGSGSLDKVGAVQYPAADDVGGSKGMSEEEGYSGEGEEEEMSGEELEKVAVQKVSSIDDDKKKKKKDKKEKEKEPGKKGKGKDKKGKGVKESALFTSDEEAEEMAEDVLNEEDALIELDPVSGLARRSVRSTKSNNLQDLEPEIEDYPNDVEDVQGIYEMERERRSSNLPKITAKEHSIPCNTKKAIVVRAFVQIPQVDESMQRALLAASMSYADTCKTEAAIFKTYKTEDPRTPEEKLKQTAYKQQLIEQNIDEMHLLEQKPGPVLRFHF